jgi:hypothetical protein
LAVGRLLDRLIEAACAVAVVALTVIVSLQVFNRFVERLLGLDVLNTDSFLLHDPEKVTYHRRNS